MFSSSSAWRGGRAIYQTWCRWKTRGYCIVTVKLAAAQQPQVRQLADDIDAVLKDIPGIRDGNIGGYSALDSTYPTSSQRLSSSRRDHPTGFQTNQLTGSKKFIIRAGDMLPPSPVPA